LAQVTHKARLLEPNCLIIRISKVPCWTVGMNLVGGYGRWCCRCGAIIVGTLCHQGRSSLNKGICQDAIQIVYFSFPLRVGLLQSLSFPPRSIAHRAIDNHFLIFSWTRRYLQLVQRYRSRNHANGLFLFGTHVNQYNDVVICSIFCLGLQFLDQLFRRHGRHIGKMPLIIRHLLLTFLVASFPFGVHLAWLLGASVWIRIGLDVMICNVANWLVPIFTSTAVLCLSSS
jgi:hypothetical protein